jgi:RNA polymerase sigma-70 factor (ECF subfamily)
VESRDSAEDVVQDVFWRVWRRWSTVRSDGNVRGYLYTAARAGALDHVASAAAEARRRERYEAPVPLSDDVTEPEAEGLTPERIAHAIEQVLATLPPRQRAAATLRLTDRLTTAAIATRLSISPRTVEVHIARATRALRDQLPRLLP